MPLMIVGLILNSVAMLSVCSNDNVGGIFAGVMLFCWAVSVLGLVLVLAGRKVPGAIMVIVGSVAYVPLGLVAVFGAKKILVAGRQTVETPA